MWPVQPECHISAFLPVEVDDAWSHHVTSVSPEKQTAQAPEQAPGVLDFYLNSMIFLSQRLNSDLWVKLKIKWTKLPVFSFIH